VFLVWLPSAELFYSDCRSPCPFGVWNRCVVLRFYFDCRSPCTTLETGIFCGTELSYKCRALPEPIGDVGVWCEVYRRKKNPAEAGLCGELQKVIG
jgi:hypothetical protein